MEVEANENNGGPANIPFDGLDPDGSGFVAADAMVRNNQAVSSVCMILDRLGRNQPLTH